MNIFILHKDPDRNASYHVDKHIVKMPLETAQILCSVLHIWGRNKNIPYKPTHLKHPCVLWASESASNFLRLVRIGLALCDEYEYRYSKIHKCKSVISWCFKESIIPDTVNEGLTAYAQAMPEQYKNKNAVIAYRNYYLSEKQHLFKWTNRSIPDFIAKNYKNDNIGKD